jgi:hypothetical protein
VPSATDWRDIVAWTSAHNRQALPAEPDTVALYVADLADRGVRPSTLSRRLVAISQAHKTVDLPTPTSSSAVRRVYVPLVSVAHQAMPFRFSPMMLLTVKGRSLRSWRSNSSIVCGAGPLRMGADSLPTGTRRRRLSSRLTTLM